MALDFHLNPCHEALLFDSHLCICEQVLPWHHIVVGISSSPLSSEASLAFSVNVKMQTQIINQRYKLNTSLIIYLNLLLFGGLATHRISLNNRF
jgi:hypothetical protein